MVASKESFLFFIRFSSEWLDDAMLRGGWDSDLMLPSAGGTDGGSPNVVVKEANLVVMSRKVVEFASVPTAVDSW